MVPFGNAVGQGFVNGVVSKITVAVLGPGDGIFIYSPTPALGNLVASFTGALGGTDSFGNTYQAGLTSYNGSHWVSVQAGEIVFSDGTFISSLNGTARIETVGGVAVVLNDGTGELDLDPTGSGKLLTNGNSITGLFGNLDPSGLPLSGSATLGAVISAVNSMFSRFQVMGVFQ